jgi:hypothetical protein
VSDLTQPKPKNGRRARVETSWGRHVRPAVIRGNGSTHPIDGDAPTTRVPVGFRPVDAGSRWGEALWTARDLT